MANEQPKGETVGNIADGTILAGAVGGRDENGITTFTIPFYAKDASSIPTVGSFGEEGQEVDENGKAKILGLVEETRNWVANNDGSGSFQVNVVFKGFIEGGSEDGSKEQEKLTEQWSLDYDWAEAALECHPKIDEIVAMYGGRQKADGTFVFPEKLPKDAQGSKLGGKNKKAGDKNPLFGTKTYPSLEAKATRSFAVKTLKADYFEDIGRVWEKVPDMPQEFQDLTPGDRTWLQTPPKITQNGDVWRVQIDFILSKPGGWPDVMFNSKDF